MIKDLLLCGFFMAAVALTSCSKEYQCKTRVDNPCPWCGVDNPVKENPWLKRTIEETCEMRMFLRVYVCTMNDGRQAFFLTDPGIDDGYECLHNCQGELIGYRGGIAGRVEGDWSVNWGTLRLIYEI